MNQSNVREFVAGIYYGDELIFVYKGEKFFSQGFLGNDGICTAYLDRWEPPADDSNWVGKGDSKKFPVKKFLNAKLWDNKSFWNAESEMEWVDA